MKEDLNTFQKVLKDRINQSIKLERDWEFFYIFKEILLNINVIFKSNNSNNRKAF